MATFYGTVQGARGEATRLGHSSSGLHVTAQSYSGSIIVNLSVGDNDVVHAHIAIGNGSTGSGGYTLYAGPIEGLFADQKNFGR